MATNDTTSKPAFRAGASFVAVVAASVVLLAVASATVYFGYSFCERVSRVFAERAQIYKDITNLEQLRRNVEAVALKPPDQKMLNRLNERFRELSESLGLQKQLRLAAMEVETLQGEFEAEFGRRVKFSPGPPPTYDAGPPPYIPGPDSVVPLIHAFIGGGRTHIKLAKWKAAAEACRLNNTFSSVFAPSSDAASASSNTIATDGVSVADTAIQRLDAELEDVRAKRSVLDTLPAEVPLEAEKLHRRLRTSWWVLGIFAITDFLACVTSLPLLMFSFGRFFLLTRQIRPRRLFAR